MYFSAIMDLFNGEIVSYRIQNRPTFDVVGKMLNKGISEIKTVRKTDTAFGPRLAVSDEALSKAVGRQWLDSEYVA